jgi:phosphoribosylformylglycinamidine cyclo-ligase
MLKDGVHAVVNKNSYEVPALFKMLAKDGNIEEQMMYNTYNMGLGMIVAVDKADADKAVNLLKAAGETAYIIGEVKEGEKGVTVC